jgi:hypothetical protein
MNVHPVDLFMYNPSTTSVQYTINPTAGVAIANLCALVIRGGRKPCVVELMVKREDATSVNVPPFCSMKLPVVPINRPTKP